jgi:hypothetical protein
MSKHPFSNVSELHCDQLEDAQVILRASQLFMQRAHLLESNGVQPCSSLYRRLRVSVVLRPQHGNTQFIQLISQRRNWERAEQKQRLQSDALNY